MSRTVLLAHAILATLAWATLVAPAAALSCMRPEVEATFAQAKADPRVYVLALGRLTPLPGEAPPADPAVSKAYALETRFEGRLASRDGFVRDTAFPVTVAVACAGPWCGGAPEGEQLMFLERRDGRHLLEAGPCPWFAFPASEDAVARALACLDGAPCEPR